MDPMCTQRLRNTGPIGRIYIERSHPNHSGCTYNKDGFIMTHDVLMQTHGGLVHEHDSMIHTYVHGGLMLARDGVMLTRGGLMLTSTGMPSSPVALSLTILDSPHRNCSCVSDSDPCVHGSSSIGDRTWISSVVSLNCFVRNLLHVMTTSSTHVSVFP